MSALLHERPARLPLRQACVALGLNRSTVYARRRRAGGEPEMGDRSRKGSPQPRALGPEERQQVLETLHSEPYRDQPPAEAYQRSIDASVRIEAWDRATMGLNLPRGGAMATPKKRDEGFPALKVWLAERILERQGVFELPVVQATDVAEIAALYQQFGLLDTRARVGVTAIGMALGQLGCPVWRASRLRARVIDEGEARKRELWQWEALLRRRRAG